MTWNNYQYRVSHNHKTIFSLSYPSDLDEAYAFYCARYDNISYEDFMQLGYFEFKKKIGSIPDDEPLAHRIKSRVISLGKIKNKEERDYWREQRRMYEIPQVYLPIEDIDARLENYIKERGGSI